MISMKGIMDYWSLVIACNLSMILTPNSDSIVSSECSCLVE